MDEPVYITVAQAAKVAGLSKRTLYNLARNGHLFCFRAGSGKRSPIYVHAEALRVARLFNYGLDFGKLTPEARRTLEEMPKNKLLKHLEGLTVEEDHEPLRLPIPK